MIANVASRHESAREFWLEKEREMESQLKDMKSERERVSSEVEALKNELKEERAKLEAKTRDNDDLLAKARIFSCTVFSLSIVFYSTKILWKV